MSRMNIPLRIIINNSSGRSIPRDSVNWNSVESGKKMINVKNSTSKRTGKTLLIDMVEIEGNLSFSLISYDHSKHTDEKTYKKSRHNDHEYTRPARTCRNAGF